MYIRESLKLLCGYTVHDVTLVYTSNTRPLRWTI